MWNTFLIGINCCRFYSLYCDLIRNIYIFLDCLILPIQLIFFFNERYGLSNERYGLSNERDVGKGLFNERVGL